MTAVLPALWTDWCKATGAAEARVDEDLLERFSRQASPSKAVLARLRHRIGPAEPVAPTWPHEHHDDKGSLRRLIRRTTVMVQDPATHWMLRLRLRRMLFAAVLLAPRTHGGLGLNRAQARQLRPATLERLRPRVGVAGEPGSCPACAVWSWLDVIGTNNGWSHGAVRVLGHRRDQEGTEHRHELPDTSPDWHLCIGLLPAIDRWGYVNTYSSLHPSSLSAVASAMATLLEGPPPVPAPMPEPCPARPRRAVSGEEEAAILARADELNARVTRILAEYG